jgi:hypothetical protein
MAIFISYLLMTIAFGFFSFAIELYVFFIFLKDKIKIEKKGNNEKFILLSDWNCKQKLQTLSD